MPFLEYEDKWVILLALTSNQGALDFQYLKDGQNKALFQNVITSAKNWGTKENLMFVAGATRGEDLDNVRELADEHFLLVPGVGAQGGTLESVFNHAGLKKDIGLIVNSSRGIIYASSNENFENDARTSAKELSDKMSKISF